MKLVYSIITAALLTSCSFTFNQTDTHGEAEDLIDNTPTNNPTIEPDISIPVSMLPSLSPSGAKK